MEEQKAQHMSIRWHELADVETEKSALHSTLKEKSALVGRLSLMMLSAGTSAWRVRASMNRLARGLGITVNADIGLLSVSYTCMEGGETYTNALSIPRTGVNMEKLRHLEYFADSFPERADRYSVEQFHSILDKFEQQPGHYRAWQVALAAGAACAAFAFLLGGGPLEMLFAFFGASAGQFLRKKLIEKHITLLANVSVSVALACAVYVLCCKLWEAFGGVGSAENAGYICSMLFVIPGFPLITGGIDLAKLDLRSGLERLTYALLIILTATLTGWLTARAFLFSPTDFPELTLKGGVRLLLRLEASFIGVYGFSYLFNSRRRLALTAGLIGMAANTFRLLLVDYTEIAPNTAAFFGAFTAGILAGLAVKKLGCPRIALTVPAIVIMVPGMYLYKGIFYLNADAVADGTMWLLKAVKIMTALPLGLIFARIVSDGNFRRSS